MADLTSKQVTALANSFLLMAQSILEYRNLNIGNLSESQDKQLRDLHWNLINYSDDLFSYSAVIMIDDVEESLTAIGNITDQIKEAYKKITKVQKALDVAASIVTLGAALFSKSPRAIADAIGGLAKTWKE